MNASGRNNPLYNSLVQHAGDGCARLIEGMTMKQWSSVMQEITR